MYTLCMMLSTVYTLCMMSSTIVYTLCRIDLRIVLYCVCCVEYDSVYSVV